MLYHFIGIALALQSWALFVKILLSRHLSFRINPFPFSVSTVLSEKIYSCILYADAYSMLQSWSCRRGWCRGWWSRWWVRTTITDHRSLRQRYGTWGLSPENEGEISLHLSWVGVGSVLTHYLIMWLEVDGQHNTREGSSRWDPAHC